jgi:hypothetical protein
MEPEYDWKELEAELERAATRIDGEIKALEDAKVDPKEVWDIEFTV